MYLSFLIPNFDYIAIKIPYFIILIIITYTASK